MHRRIRFHASAEWHDVVRAYRQFLHSKDIGAAATASGPDLSVCDQHSFGWEREFRNESQSLIVADCVGQRRFRAHHN